MTEHQSVHIEIESPQGTKTIELALSDLGCWSNLLGNWMMPANGAIEQLGDALSSQDASRITLIGCPSACMLPLVWIRSIWFPVAGPKLVIHWTQIDNPTEFSAQQTAAKLALGMADQVECADPDGAWKHWGFDLANKPTHEESFDLLANLFDLWDRDDQVTLTGAGVGVNKSDLLRRALINCASQEHTRIAIYGAGTHTREIGDALMEPGVEIVCIIDDDARRHGDKMGGYPIVSCEQAQELDLDAVVISADSIEDILWERCDVFRVQGIATFRLYSANV